jgi:hypothetical protein
MQPRLLAPILFLVCMPLLGGCRSRAEPEMPHRAGARIDIATFIARTAAYKGKAIMLALKVDEPIPPSEGKSLRDYVGRDVKFTALGHKGERLKLVVTIPAGLDVPAAGREDEVFVTFVCTRGSLQEGNVARAIQSH